MTAFYRSLNRSLSRTTQAGGEAPITRIVHFGDSHVAADIMTGWLRRRLDADIGDAGPGFLIPGQPSALRPNAQTGRSAGWHVDGLKQNELGSDGRYGLSGTSLTTNRPGEEAWVSAGCDRFEVYLLKQPYGGRVQIFLDGELSSELALVSSHYEPLYVPISIVQPKRESPAHRIRLVTTDDGPVRLLGIVAERNEPGIVYDALGVNGARASRPLQWDWKTFSDNLIHRRPDLIVVAYGSNEVGDTDLDVGAYQHAFSELLSRLRASAPQASLLVISPPDRTMRAGDQRQVEGWPEISAMASLVGAQREAALGCGAAFCDLYQAMGGAGAINRWAQPTLSLAQPDHVHLTKAGYHLVADALYRAIETGYLRALWSGFEALVAPAFVQDRELPGWRPKSVTRQASKKR